MTSKSQEFSNAPTSYPQAYPQGYGSPPGAQYGGAQPPAYGYPPQGNSNVIVNSPYSQPPVIVTNMPPRETGTPPDTTCSLVFSILSIFLCLGAWPFAVVAIVFNRKAKGQVDLGQYTVANRTLRTAYIFIGVTVVLGIIAWVIFGLRLKAALDLIDDAEERRDRYYG